MRSLLVAVPCLVVAACADHRAGRVGDIDPAISNVVFRARGALPLSVQSSVDVAIGDFDQDGDTDLAALDLTGRLVVRLRTGEDSYADAQALPVQGKPLAILAEDLDADYDLDLVAVSAEANVATVFVNDGAATFSQIQAIGVQELPTGAAIGDYTGDGVDDLVVTHLSRSDVLVFEGQGDATFGAPTSVPIPRGTRTAGLTIADVNHDTFQDIAICDTDNDRVIIRFGSPSEIGGGVAIVDVARTPVAMSVGDVNEDLRIDLAISCFDSLQVDFITDQGKGGFGVFRSLSVEGKPANSTIADLDGDGFDEFAVCLLNKSAVSIFAGTDEGLSDAEYQLPATGFPYRPIIADIIGDGRADLGLVSTEIAAMNFYRGTAEFLHCERTVAPEGAWQPHMVAAADFDGDGEIDIATAGASSNLVSFLTPSRQPTGPVLAEPASVDLGQGFSNLVVADVDGDERSELLVALVDGVKLLANESSAGSFQFAPVPAAASAMLAPGTVAAGIAFGDATGDGLGDVVVAFLGENRVAVVPGAPGRFQFAAPVGTAVQGGPFGVVLGNFDADAAVEVAVSLALESRVDIFDVASDGTLSQAASFPVGEGPTYLRTADFNRDGRADLAVSSSLDDSLRILVAEEASGFRSVEIPTAPGPTALLTDDLDLDGYPDLLVTSLSAMSFQVVIGDRSGGEKSRVTFPGVYGATSAVLADVVGGDLPDLVIGSAEIDRVTVFQNDSVKSALR
ncbi:MAG: VCBS repeat-containing protein [Planctomycetes bacterium]|nr:VCBS repeat-containing protein [Planctomycetota bacterium]